MGVFQMPSLGADMEDGVLVEWMVKPGDTVKRGDIVAVVETQKGAIEVEIFENGVVQSLDAPLGTKLPVGASMATILADGETAPKVSETARTETSTAEPTKPVRSTAPAAKLAFEPALTATGLAASPAARQKANDLGISLATLRGSGPGGAIVLANVESAAPAATVAPVKPKPGKPADAMAEMRKAIAAAMQRSKQEIPHFQLSQVIDIQAASDWLAARNADVPPTDRILLGTLFMKAAAIAAAKVKEMNGHYSADGFASVGQVNLGVAVALRGGGLIAPAIPEANTLPLPALMDAMRDLVARARAMRLRSSEMTCGTITVSSLGEKGADAMSGIIFPPQVALLAIGSPQRRPWVVGNNIIPRKVVTFTLSADHRVSDGRQAAKFLAEIDTQLQTPEAL